MFDCGINEIVSEVMSSVEKENERMIYKAVQSVGIDVDKEQLEKALFNAKSFYIDGYKDAKKKYEPKWIPTSEREPEEYGEYYITWITPSFDHPLIAICEGEVTWEWDDERNRWKFEWLLEDYIKAYPDVKVTAWMPLIEAYKESE